MPRSRIASQLRLGTGPTAVTLSSLAAVMVVSLMRWGPDWPAQEFRARLAHDFGLVTWNNLWYAGHALPGYSALYPIVASLVGASWTGVVSVVAAAWAAQRLLPADSDRTCRHAVAAAVTVSTGAGLLVGQVTFLLGMAFGLSAIVALRADRPRTTLLLAISCSLASSLAGLFLLLAAYALAATEGWRRTCLLAGALAGPVVATVAGGAGGAFPYPWQDLVGGLAFCAAVRLGSRVHDLPLRRLSGIYSLTVVVMFAIPSPLGGNVDRLGVFLALPLAAWALTRDAKVNRRVAAGMLAVAVFWTVIPLVSDIANGAPDPSRQSTFYRGFLQFLRTQDPMAGRLEVVLTRGHWESAFVAPSFPLARGWERQIDIEDNGALYRPLSATAYRAWLSDAGVGLVAVANAPVDYAGRAETELLRHPPSYLQQVYADRDWRVWKVIGARGLVTGAARLTRLGPASFDAEFSRPGSAVVRLRASAMWEVSAGMACLSATSSGWLEVTASRPGSVTVRARLNRQLLTGWPECDRPFP